MSLLTVSHIKKAYGATHVLQDITLTIERGEFVGIMGPSGAGKSTLLNVIATIDKPTAGSIVIDGDEITALKRDQLAEFRRRKLGFVFQDYNLLDTLTVRENIVLPLALMKHDAKEAERQATHLAGMLGLTQLLDKYPVQLSGGQRQRTAVARAMITNPSVVLADEPTGALDSKSSRDVLQCLSELNEREGATILMVTHDAFAASFCKRILFIKDGQLFTQLVRSGDRKAFFNQIIDVLQVLGGDLNDAR